MSNTVITSYTDVSGGISKSGKQLVLLVNKDGTLSLEKNVLQSLLDESNPENVAVSLVHVNEDGKAAKEECQSDDGDDDIPHVNLTVNAFYDPKSEQFKQEVLDEITATARELFRLSFQNDHCYTPHTLPDEDDLLPTHNIKLDYTESKTTIPSSKKITVLENKIIPKGKKLNLPASDGQYILKRSDILKKLEAQKGNATSIISGAKSSIISGIQENKQADIVTSPVIITKDLLTESKKGNSFQNEFLKNITKDVRSPTVIDRNVKSLLTKKIESRKVSHSANTEDVGKPSKVVNTYSKEVKGGVGKKVKRSSTSESKEMEGPKVTKALKKKPGHVNALLNDMTSLFSTPDVLRRVSTDAKSPKPTTLNTNKTLDADQQDTFKFKSEIRTYSNKANPQMIYKKDNKDEMEPLSEIFQDGNYAELDELPRLHTEPNSINALMSPSTNMNAPLLPTLDVLAEGLSEDLLMDVARLVESSEKLQEVIDTQVLGNVSVNDVQSKEMYPMQTPIVPQVDSSQIPEKRSATPPVMRKEPIQIVRSNGRVITLPPIEAPATRASKRKSLLNATLDQPSITPQIIIPTVDVPQSSQATPVKTVATVSKKVTKADKHLLTALPTEVEEEKAVDSDESWNSEDDPDRLWCICKQPHNNRFMICCDMCEDWFHGKCVNITKAMGQEMEEKGVEWRCPTCVKKKNAGRFPFKPNSPHSSHDNKNEGPSDSEAYSHLAVTPKKSQVAESSSTTCIVCKKAARPSSIYCSDACILKHAQESLSVPSPTLSGNKRNTSKDDIRVIVYERKTGKCLAGPNAPTAANLKTWLRDNPTFEVVRPGTIPSNKLSPQLVNKSKAGAQKVQSVLKVGDDKQIKLVQPQRNPLLSPPHGKTNQPKVTTPTTPKVSEPEHSPKLHIKLPTKQTKTYAKSPSTPTQHKQATIKSPTTPVHQRKEEIKIKTSGSESIRENVKKTLQEQISIRMAETKDVNFSKEDICKFALETELELHDLFKDVGVKYKAKYRSLMFNLKDRKNLSLWQKICDRQITPKQLVRLSPEELASQELAQWRDQEAKHQLELIKKSELDLLACNKSYVLKTHKGEEVIENKSLPTTELDPNVTLDDIVSALNHGADEEKKEASVSQEEETGKHSHHSHSSHHKHSRDRSTSKSKRDRSNDKHKSSSKHDSSRSSRSSGRSRHKKRSRSRTNKHSESSRRSSHHDSHGSSSHKHHSTTSKDKDQEKEHSDKSPTKRSRSRDRSKGRSHSTDKSKSSKDHDKSKSMSKESDKSHHHHHHHHSKSHEVEEGEKLILKVAEETDILLPPVVDGAYVASPPSPHHISENVLNIIGAESDQEPSSSMDSSQSIWSGTLGMVDVAKFNVSVYEVYGTCSNIAKDLRTELEIVGRIQPETVWDYISKMKKQTNKEILLTKILPADESQHSQHSVFYNYLNSRNRLAVVKSHGGAIKDFYILPLPSNAALPSVLSPPSGCVLDDFRPNLLLGVIVGQKRKRSSTASSSIPPKVSKLKEKEERSYTPPMGSHTPPTSPKSSVPLYPKIPGLSSTVKHQIAASLASGDDEPYSPGDSDSATRSPTDLHRKMEELDRKIEERKKQIQSIAGNITSTNVLDEPYSPSRPMTPEASSKPSIPRLSDISLPSNLQEILATIQQKSATTSDVKATQEPYVPTAINVEVTTAKASISYKQGLKDVDMRILGSSYSQMHSSNVYPTSTSEKATSKLASLSEAELLSMVPDSEVFPPLPPLPAPLQDLSVPPPPYKRPRMDTDQPPPPGLEDDDD